MNGSPSLSWRRFPARYRLEGSKCQTCGRIFFPPRDLCPFCRRKGKMVPHTLSGRGKVYSYTVVRVAPSGFEREVPYTLAVVELDEGPRVLAQVKGEVDIGTRVRAVFRKITEDGESGLIHYGYKFVPEE